MDFVDALNRVAKRMERILYVSAEQVANEREQLLGYLTALHDFGVINWCERAELSHMAYQASKRCGWIPRDSDGDDTAPQTGRYVVQSSVPHAGSPSGARWVDTYTADTRGNCELWLYCILCNRIGPQRSRESYRVIEQPVDEVCPPPIAAGRHDA
ncbi:hypothetical protein P3T65_26965 [Pseudomonas nitroreducens]|uniref:hypothetical protein n=1 Tax=Pseudomonas nitroreducens TaxID=46680 RepID=UPI0023F81BCA|nr:hypothetical protein [Pseudomonas nitroreducens]WEW97825.1 hypothetical protein P3T65_26965 [Pseudomonas nitroreducens]